MSNQAVAINGAKWTTTATVINTLLSFCQLAIVARVLEPTIFGLVSICTLVLNFFHIFANLGFTNSIISKQENDKKILSTIFFASIALGFTMGALIYLSSGFVVDYYDEPKLSHVIKVSAITFPMIYTSQIYWNLLQKELKFKILAVIEVIGAVLNIVLTVTLAYSGFEERSIIYSQVIFTGVKTFLYILLGKNLFTPVWYFKLGEIKDHLRFGIYHMAEGVLGFVNGNLENIVIGKAVGIKELGLYTIAYQLAVFPITRLNPIIMQVSYPIMAKMKDIDGLKRAYLKIVDFISFCNYPLLSGLFITSSSVVVLIYGADYEGSVQLVKIIVFVSFLACVIAPASSVALSRNKPNLMFYVNLISLIVKIPTLYFFSQAFGLIGIAYGYVITSLLETIIVFYIVNHLVGSFLKKLVSNILMPISFCLIMVGLIFLYQRFIGNTGLIHLIAQVIIGGAVYIGLTLKYKLSLSEMLALKKSL
ncbi:MOP flippase family protein [Pedobacter heparinus]|uniref:Polysaccharide biosynthesis protein n=1 Tax=Pedobacter heparinus (strain ATCC 13125 / DSM 2366 / CIP 104194 / JCM 7457 / NBRC 12017 / NCIMB 9290 / NRRL B-14731 / HIM 762-3) TaxID=485917 RepID=C6XW97_PEDHD|nr:MOP flippase family protein [Pedobacter heparinus]ACU04176.1 polysaccharide biosynthesis protein [Pedobacter heparinus DSM 2366]